VKRRANDESFDACPVPFCQRGRRRSARAPGGHHLGIDRNEHHL